MHGSQRSQTCRTASHRGCRRSMAGCACPPRAAESNRAGGPCHSEPEIRVLVSMTSFTRPALPACSLHLGGDFLLGHGLARLGADSVQHNAEFSSGLSAAQFCGDQPAHRCRFEQAVGACFVQQRVGQIQLDGDAHGACLVEGDRTDAPRTDGTVPTLFPRTENNISATRE